MNKRMIIITGQEGVGKSTIIRALIGRINMSAQIDGEDLGQVNPMEYSTVLRLIWRNVYALAENYWNAGFENVVTGSFLDGYHQYREFRSKLPNDVQVYIIQLCASKETRDRRRCHRAKPYDKAFSDMLDEEFPEDSEFERAEDDFDYMKVRNDNLSIENTVSIIEGHLQDRMSM